MFTTAALASMAPIGRRIGTSAVGHFLKGGPVGMGALGGDSDGGLGIIPLIVGAVAAGGSAYTGSKAADAAKDAAIATAEAQADAMIAPFRYEFKTQKHLIQAGRFETAVDAVSGRTVIQPKSNTGLYVGVALAAAVLFGAIFIVKAV